MVSHTYESVRGASDIDVRMEWAECPVNTLTYRAFRQREAALNRRIGNLRSPATSVSYGRAVR
jgi:hypothetical protein